MKRRLITADEAERSDKQHSKPCSDCPWAREALQGWTGSMTPEEWLQAAHGEAKIDCHAIIGPQCAGSAIYRANVCKKPRDPGILRLPSNRETVFAAPAEFLKHHNKDDE